MFPMNVPKRPPLILVIDDEPDMLDLVEQQLAPHFEVVISSNGREALAFLEGPRKADLIVTDVYMPGPNGLELYEYVQRAAPPIPPMLFMTAFSEDLERRGIASRDILVKPFPLAELESRIREILEGTKQR